MKQVLSAMGIPIFTKEGYEADDILGTVAKRAQKEGMEVTILSGDRDLLQLADEHIKISIPKTSRGLTEVHHYYPQDVEREYQVTPKEFIDVKALMGDASDNIPGVPSIGQENGDQPDRPVPQPGKPLRPSGRGKAAPGKESPGGEPGAGKALLYAGQNLHRSAGGVFRRGREGRRPVYAGGV